MEPATDLDVLVKRGFEREEAQQALRRTRGDVDAAAKLMVSGGDVEEWVDSSPGEWRDNMDSQVSLNSKSRALCRSNFYISVPSYTHKQISDADIKVFYRINVIMRDGRSWKLEKRYSQIHEFWRSLPFGSLTHFQNPFPQPRLRISSPTEEILETRRNQLDAWMQEMSLDHKSMVNEKLVSRLNSFLGVDEHEVPPPGSADFGDVSSWTHIPATPCQTKFHLSLEDFSKAFPVKIDTADVQDASLAPISTAGADTALAQIRKDLSRDRIIVQGRRIEGSEAGLEGVLRTCIQAAADVIRESGGAFNPSEDSEISVPQPTVPVASTSPPPPGMAQFDQSIIEELCLCALRQIGRTESAFLSFSCLHHMVDLSLVPDIIVVPESTLAKPLLLRFRRDGAAGNALNKPHVSVSARERLSNTPISRTETAESSREAPSLPPASSASLGPAGSHSSASKERRRSPDGKSASGGLGGGAVARSSNGTSGEKKQSGSSMMAYINSVNASSSPLVCDMQAATVFRFCDAMSMETVLQVKVTYCRSIKLPPTTPTLRSDLSNLKNTIASKTIDSPISSEANLSEDENTTIRRNRYHQLLQSQFLYSKNYIIIDKETKTSNRDWNLQG